MESGHPYLSRSGSNDGVILRDLESEGGRAGDVIMVAVVVVVGDVIEGDVGEAICITWDSR
jgi:hypothetical protein